MIAPEGCRFMNIVISDLVLSETEYTMIKPSAGDVQ